MPAIAFLRLIHWFYCHVLFAGMASFYRGLAIAAGNVVFGLFVSRVGKQFVGAIKLQ